MDDRKQLGPAAMLRGEPWFLVPARSAAADKRGQQDVVVVPRDLREPC
jgi:hypothetical protein